MLIPNGWRSETKRGRDKLRGDGFGIGCRFVLALPCSGFACEITGGERRWPDGVKEGSCLRRWLAWLRRQPHQTQTEQGVASPSTIAVPVGVPYA